MSDRENGGAPARRGVALAVLLACALLAVIVIALHAINVGSLRGEIPAGTCVVEDAQRLYDGGGVRELAGGAGQGAISLVQTPQEQGGDLSIRGALMRPGEQVAQVRVRVGLIREQELGGARGDGVILLNTQMVRRPDLAQEYGCDDHCGFAALARISALEDGVYAVVLIDESDGTRRLLDTGVHIGLTGGALSTAVKYADGEAAGDA